MKKYILSIKHEINEISHDKYEDRNDFSQIFYKYSS